MAGDEVDPLLQEEQAPWEEVEDLEAGQAGTIITLDSLFKSKQGDETLKTIQSAGISKIATFKEDSNIVYAAFEGSPIITIGHRFRNIDAEPLWRSQLQAAAKKAKPTGWSSDVTVEAYVLNIPDAADADKDGLLQPLLKRYQAGACSLAVFGLPAVQATIHYKWQAFARKLLIWELSFFVVWLLSFYGFTWLFQDEDLSLSLGQLLHTKTGILTVAFEFLALLAMVPFLVLEQGTLSAYGLYGWMNIWNGLDIATYAIQLAVTVMHLGRICLDSNALSILLALQCIFLLFRIQYYSRVFKSTRFAFLEAVRDVISEIKYYFVFILIIIFGFAAAFHVLFRRDQGKMEHFDSFPHSFLTVYAASAEGIEYDEILQSHVPIAGSILNVAYAFVMGMVLINLLIGIMSNALEKVTQHEALKLLLHKAQIIDELEATMPRWLEDRYEGIWYPKWIHILRIDPDNEGKIDLEATWGGDDGDGGSEGSKSGKKEAPEATGSGVDVEQIVAQLAVIQTQLNQLLDVEAGKSRTLSPGAPPFIAGTSGGGESSGTGQGAVPGGNKKGRRGRHRGRGKGGQGEVSTS